MFVNYQGKTMVISQEETYSLLRTLQYEQSDNIYCTAAGKLINYTSDLSSISTVYIFDKLKGGKGGFGAKLKNQGGKKVKPNQNMFSRDLQGRPIAYSNIQRDYKDYYLKKIEEEEKVNKQIAEYKVVENTLKEEYAFMKLDRTYNAQIQETENKLSNSLKTGLSKFFEKKLCNKEQKSEEKAKDEQSKEKESEQIKQCDNCGQDQKQKCEGKRQRVMLADDLAEDKGPTKKIKLNTEVPNQEKASPKQQTIAEIQKSTPKYSSARDKLKNLFKK